MIKTGDRVQVGSHRGTIDKEMMGNDVVVRLDNGQRMGAHKRNCVLLSDQATVAIGEAQGIEGEETEGESTEGESTEPDPQD